MAKLPHRIITRELTGKDSMEYSDELRIEVVRVFGGKHKDSCEIVPREIKDIRSVSASIFPLEHDLESEPGAENKQIEFTLAERRDDKWFIDVEIVGRR